MNILPVSPDPDAVADWGQWPEVDETTQIVVERERLAEMLVTMGRLRNIVANAELPESYRQELRAQIEAVRAHLAIPARAMMVDMLFRDN